MKNNFEKFGLNVDHISLNEFSQCIILYEVVCFFWSIIKNIHISGIDVLIHEISFLLTMIIVIVIKNCFNNILPRQKISNLFYLLVIKKMFILEIIKINFEDKTTLDVAIDCCFILLSVMIVFIIVMFGVFFIFDIMNNLIMNFSKVQSYFPQKKCEEKNQKYWLPFLTDEQKVHIEDLIQNKNLQITEITILIIQAYLGRFSEIFRNLPVIKQIQFYLPNTD